MNHSRKPLIASLIVAAVLLAVGGFDYYSHHKEPSTSAKTQTVQVTTTDATASWKTYANIRYGFDIKYPAPFQVQEGSGYGEDKTTAVIALYDDSNEEVTYVPVQISIKPVPSDFTTLNSLIIRTDLSAPPRAIAFGGQQALRADYLRRTGSSDYGQLLTIDSDILFRKDGFIYDIQLSKLNSDDAQAEAIVSTFNFTK